MRYQRHSALHHLPAFACFAFCTFGFGQSTAPSHPQPVEIVQGQKAHPAQTSPASSTAASAKPAAGTPATPPPPAASGSVLNQPPQPAKISLADGKLAIQADNSSLSEILHVVSKNSGMKIEGLQTGGNADQRIFGSYGPGAPRDVLSDLLSGSGLNVLMLGVTASGAPRELALTSRAGGAAAAATSQANPSPDPSAPVQPEEIQPPVQYPNQDQQQQQQQPVMRNGVRTPQQMLQELQRMRNQQQEQEQQDQQQQQEQQDQDQPQPDQQQ